MYPTGPGGMNEGGDLVTRRQEPVDYRCTREAARAAHQDAHALSSTAGWQELILILPRVLDQPGGRGCQWLRGQQPEDGVAAPRHASRAIRALQDVTFAVA